MGNTHLDLSYYARIHTTIHSGTNQQDNMMRNPLITTILTQYHMSEVLNIFGDPGVADVLKELKQLHDRIVMDPKNAGKMYKCHKKAALQYLMFLYKKRCGKIKGRGCVDVKKKRKYFTKDETSTPTVAT